MIGATPGRAHLRPSAAGLVFLGGGARAAYQVGVRKGEACLLHEGRRGMDTQPARTRNPYPILVGTSAGAINTTALACRAEDLIGAAAVVEHFGDGSMRQIAPISPAIRMGADRVLVIGVGRLGSAGTLCDVNPAAYPSLAQIAGHALSTNFLDALATGIELLERLNCVADQLSAEQRHALRLKRVDSLVIAPSQRFDLLARDHAHALPPAVRALLEVLGAHGGSGAVLAGYLLFEGDYKQRLIELDCADTLARRDDVQAFLFDQETTPIRADASA